MNSINQRRNNSSQIPLMYSISLSSTSLLQDPSLKLHYNSIRMKYHQRDLDLTITHRQQQRLITGFRYHPYPLPHNPITLIGTRPGVSQTDYERVQRDKEKLVHHDHQTNNSSSFNDIYYQCRYERYAGFSHTALLNEVLSLCANIDRLEYEKSEVEKRLQDVQQDIYVITTQSYNENESESKIESNESVIESILAENK